MKTSCGDYDWNTCKAGHAQIYFESGECPLCEAIECLKGLIAPPDLSPIGIAKTYDAMATAQKIAGEKEKT